MLYHRLRYNSTNLLADRGVFLRDSGVLHFLLSLEDPEQLLLHPRYGASWEGFALEQIPSDDGSEFEGLFRKRVEKLGLGRMFTYPKTQQMNAHIERFNRTLQEDFVDYHEDLLWAGQDGLAEFKRRLADWLLWYNTERPHQALDGEVPLAVLAREAEPREDRPLYRPPPPPPPDIPASALVAGSRRTQLRRPRSGKPPPPPDIPLCRQGWARTLPWPSIRRVVPSEGNAVGTLAANTATTAFLKTSNARRPTHPNLATSPTPPNRTSITARPARRTSNWAGSSERMFKTPRRFLRSCRPEKKPRPDQRL